MVKTQVDYSRALKKLRSANKDIQKYSQVSLQQVLKEGVLKAKAVAPFDTGLTAKSVRSKYYKRDDGAEGVIIAPNAHKKEFTNRKRAFNLTQFMHNPKNFGHFRRARPDFMNLTSAYLKKRFPDLMSKNVKQKINIKYGR